MGLDGGTIPSRSDLLRRASWRLANKGNAKSTRGGGFQDLVASEDPLTTSEKEELLRSKWLVCALSNQPLKSPLVTCQLGRIYNREALIEFLLGEGQFCYSKEKLKEEGFGHLKSLKDVFELHLTENPAFAKSAKESGKVEESGEIPMPFICSVSNVEANGRQSFVALKKCGHAFTEKALSNTTEKACFTCNKPFTKDDFIYLNPNEEQFKEQQKKLDEMKVCKYSTGAYFQKQKKSKKSKRKEDKKNSKDKAESVKTDLEVEPKKRKVEDSSEKKK